MSSGQRVGVTVVGQGVSGQLHVTACRIIETSINLFFNYLPCPSDWVFFYYDVTRHHSPAVGVGHSGGASGVGHGAGVWDTKEGSQDGTTGTRRTGDGTLPNQT